MRTGFLSKAESMTFTISPIPYGTQQNIQVESCGCLSSKEMRLVLQGCS